MTRMRSRASASLNGQIAKTVEFFNVRYPGARAEQLSPIQRLVFERFTALIPIGRSDQVAVDLGCHWGRYTRFLARSFGEVWGIDAAAEAVASAPEVQNLRFRVMDLEDPTQEFPFQRGVDCFLATGLFELLRDPQRLCARLGKAANPGCRALVIIPNRRSIHYRVFRLTLWAARRLLARRSLYIYNNGARLEDVVRWMRAGGFRVAGRGAVVGLPPSVLDRLPHVVQTRLLVLDSAAVTLCGGSYHWVLMEKETGVAGATDR